VWPSPVEEVAAVFRSAGIEARLEELARGETEFPGTAARASAYDCDGRLLVVLVPVDAVIDRTKLGCLHPRPVEPPRFPFRGATVRIEQSLLNERTIWLDAGSPRHAVGLSPVQLARFVHAQPLDLVVD
jgi:prolyl-tRNA editing enzyme YbaK/EbsC (Cys-tRNA(Pro) deacylase)